MDESALQSIRKGLSMRTGDYRTYYILERIYQSLGDREIAEANFWRHDRYFPA